MEPPPTSLPSNASANTTPGVGALSSSPSGEDEAKPPDSGLINRQRSETLTSTAPSSISSVSTSTRDDPALTAAIAAARHDPLAVASLVAVRGHIMTGELLLQVLNSTTTGLTSTDATERQTLHGPNVVTEQKPTSALTIFIRQVANCLTVVLLAAMALSFGVQDWVEGGVVLAVIVTNIVIGFTQEWKAERTMASLRDLSSPTASVYRDGELRVTPSAQLVPGDVIAFRTGDVLPADVRLLAHTNLETSEAALTGESLPVAKTLDTIFDPNLALGAADRINLAYSSTVVTKGRGTGIVIATGRQTQIGKIAEEMASRQANNQGGFWSKVWDKTATLLGLRHGTPLQIKLNKFAYILLGLAVLCAIIVFSVAEFELDSDILLYAIALGIGVIPESLIPVLTITFSVGAKRMAESGVVVRRIEALEALGGVTNICSDKTGTLTQGKMVVRKLWLEDGAEYQVEEAATAFEPVGRIAEVGTEKYCDNGSLPDDVRKLATAASLCNIAELMPPDAERTGWSARGDPTEIALLVMATKLGLGRPKLLGQDVPNSEKKTPEGYQLVVEYPFDSDVKLMTTVYTSPDGEKEQALMKGAVERVLARCDSDLTEERRQRITAQAERLAGQGLRVLAFASRNLLQPAATLTRATVECDMTFLGLCALYDPPRPTSLPAVLACKKAGITVSMLTGDHAATARAIAREVGILPQDHSEGKGAVMTAQEFEALSESEVDALPTLPLVIARCSPSTKVRMVQAGRRRGLYIAMTGDGVNDAPALKQAPIGIAMGETGTDVAKAAADMVLTDDCFESIVQAVREGRTIFDNIQRFIIALLVANVGEVILLLVGLAFQDRTGESVFALTAVEILWANMVTASLPAVGLGMEVPSAEIMERPPVDGKAGVFSKLVVVDMLVYGFTMGWTCLVVFVVMVYAVGGGDLGVECNGSNGGPACDVVFQARSAVFTALILQNLIVAWAMHSLEGTLLSWKAIKHVARNKILFWSVLFGVATIPLCLYVPRFNSDVFHHGALRGVGWGVALAATVVFTLSVEGWKWLARRGGWPWLTAITGGTARPRARDSQDKGIEEKA